MEPCDKVLLDFEFLPRLGGAFLSVGISFRIFIIPLLPSVSSLFSLELGKGTASKALSSVRPVHEISQHFYAEGMSCSFRLVYIPLCAVSPNPSHFLSLPCNESPSQHVFSYTRVKGRRLWVDGRG